MSSEMILVLAVIAGLAAGLIRAKMESGLSTRTFEAVFGCLVAVFRKGWHSFSPTRSAFPDWLHSALVLHKRSTPFCSPELENCWILASRVWPGNEPARYCGKWRVYANFS
jgi:hypothetical protein